MKRDKTFDDPNIVKFNGNRADGRAEVVCNPAFTESIIGHFKAVGIPCGLDSEEPRVGSCDVVIFTTMVGHDQVKRHLKQWMVQNHVGDLDSVQ